MNSDKTDYTLKILTIGESGVGKTCILLRFTENKFMKDHLTTIGIDYKAKNITVKDKSVKVKIWDTAGQERFRTITQQYFKGADGIVLVFDVGDRNSYERIRDWMKQIQAFTKREQIGIVLLGNKCDLEDRAVTKEEGEALAQEYDLKYFETSAQNNINIKESFNYLSENVISFKKPNEQKEEGNKGKVVITDDHSSSSGKKSGCC